MLDDNVLKDLRKLLKRKKGSGPASEESPSLQEAAQGNVPQEVALEEAAAAGTNTTASGAATTSSTASGERASSNAALVEDLRTRPLWEIKEEDVALPLEIVESFEIWKADPLALLRSDSSQVPTTLVEQYDYALSVRASAASSKILWRFITTAYYDTISARSPSDRYSITKEAVAFVVDVICKSPSYDREAVEKQIISWAKEGGNNRALADRLGGLGCFFFYPNLSEWL